jgi:neutral ceramidase
MPDSARPAWLPSFVLLGVLALGCQPPASSLPDASPPSTSERFEIGTGIYDITGPAAERGMMGYAMLDQTTAGIHTRLYARAFVIGSPGGKRVVFVSADLLAVFQGVQQQVIERLRRDFGDLYTEANVLLSATHTHSGPGGTSHHVVYNATILGFDAAGFEAVVDGIYRAIVRAHDNVAPGRIRIATGELLGASINRSPAAYARNPAAERARYAHDTDTQMTLLRLESESGAELGAISWFGVHGTSMGNRNRLISGDNKGYASQRFEREKGTDVLAPRTFVAAFAQGTEGDASPNTYGGQDGGGADDVESTALSGEKQLVRARALYAQATRALAGAVDHQQTFVKMDELAVPAALTDGQPRATCPAAFGLSMIAGAEDGPGYGKEGATCADLTSLLRLVCQPKRTLCQAEKEIILEMGTQKPTPWTPNVLPLQILRVGGLALVGLPFEVTTMAARRIRETVSARLAGSGVEEIIVAGPVNAFASYLTTREEYAAQHYEGSSTHFGPWTLAAVQDQLGRLAGAMRDGTAVDRGPTPRDLRDEQDIRVVGVLYDDKPLGQEFGALVEDAQPTVRIGETARATFWGGHLANSFRAQDTFLEVERRAGGQWVTVATDRDWETRLLWKRNHCLPTDGCSEVTVEWTIPTGTTSGSYRLRHLGDWRSIDGKLHPYVGTSREFTVAP